MPTADLEALKDRLCYDTPFWAGGVQKDADGRWQLPAPNAFQGVATILSKQKKEVPAIARPWQLELDEALERQRAAEEPMRVIILKARKLGFSTWIALKFLQRVTQLLHQAAVVVAQDNDTAGEILNMARLAYSKLPTEAQLPIGFSIKPALIREGDSKNGRQHMVFGEPSRQLRNEGRQGQSVFEIDTAGSPQSGRGTTPNLLHLSEVAFWEAKQAMKKMLSMLEAMPYVLETIVAIESTANGLNHFYRRWQNAKQGSKDPDSGEVYIPIFVPWWRDPDCSRLFADDGAQATFMEKRMGNVDRYGEPAEDEPMLVELYGCTAEQLLWRRMKIQEQPDKSVQTFNQENPHSDEAAFIGSGRTVFPGVLIAKAIKATRETAPPVTGSLFCPPETKEMQRNREGMTLVPRKALWVPADRMKGSAHKLLVWEHPRKAETAPREIDGRPTTEFERRQGAYVVALDPAGGEANTFSEGDYHALKVFDHHTRMEVAVHVSRMAIHDLAYWTLLVALYYNEARLGIEVNNHGLAVVDPLTHRYRYRKMYRRELIDTTLTHQRTTKPGWETNEATKPAMESNFISLLDSDLRAGLRDPQTAAQLSTYVVTEKGKHEAQAGDYDDRLMASMIGQMMMSMKPPPRIGPRTSRERFKPVDPVTGY